MNNIAPLHEPLIREVPLSRLALAPENVRKTPADPIAEAEMKASIATHGLLENLVVRMDGPADAGAYAVIAGGRRLAAMKALAEDGTIDADHPVPCLVAADPAMAGELSLAENIVRIAMHPADQVIAFSKLADAGLSVGSIAARFGTAERLVEQRLRLGNVAPDLLDAYRAHEIDLEVLKAFSVTPDHARQMAAWEQVAGQGYRPSAWQVKRLLTEERIPGTSAVARFVGVEPYEAAGGKVLRDLFSNDDDSAVWFDDPALLNNLAMENLRVFKDELETRWKWATALVEVDWNTTARYGADLSRAGRAHAGRAGRDREAGGPPGRPRRARRRRLDRGTGPRGRDHRGTPRRDRGRDRGPRRLQARGFRDRRLHRHHRTRRHAPGHPWPGPARGHAEGTGSRRKHRCQIW